MIIMNVCHLGPARTNLKGFSMMIKACIIHRGVPTKFILKANTQKIPSSFESPLGSTERVFLNIALLSYSPYASCASSS